MYDESNMDEMKQVTMHSISQRSPNDKNNFQILNFYDQSRVNLNQQQINEDYGSEFLTSKNSSNLQQNNIVANVAKGIQDQTKANHGEGTKRQIEEHQNIAVCPEKRQKQFPISTSESSENTSPFTEINDLYNSMISTTTTSNFQIYKEK